MSVRNLFETCENMKEEIGDAYDLGPGDAKDLFVEVWEELTGGPNSKELQAAVDLLTEHFTIS